MMKINETHTPAPWKAGEVLKGDESTLLSDEVWVTPGPGHSGPIAIVSGSANAHIIAAAPELLAACEYVIAMDWHGIGAPHVYEQLRAAIAKARGV